MIGLAERLGYNAVIDVLKAPQSPMPLFPMSETEQRELAVFLLSRNTMMQAQNDKQTLQRHSQGVQQWPNK